MTCKRYVANRQHRHNEKNTVFKDRLSESRWFTLSSGKQTDQNRQRALATMLLSSTATRLAKTPTAMDSEHSKTIIIVDNRVFLIAKKNITYKLIELIGQVKQVQVVDDDRRCC